MKGFENLQYIIFVKSVPFVLLIIFTLIVIVWHSRRMNFLVRTLFLFMLFSSVFLVNNTLEQIADTRFWTVFFAAANYPFIAGLPALWLIFTLNYAGRKFPPKKWHYAALFSNSAIATVLAFTNSSHRLIWKSIDFIKIENLLVMRVEHGAWFWVTAALSYGMVIFGSAFFMKEFMKPHNIYRKQHLWMFAGIAVTLSVNLIYIFRVFPMLKKDFTPLAFCLAGIFFSISVLRHRFLDLVPASRNMIVDLLDDGIVVFDLDGRIIDINSCAKKILETDGDIVGRNIRVLGKSWKNLDKVDFFTLGNSGIELPRRTNGRTRYYRIKKASLVSSGNKIGNLCTFTDVTSQTILNRQLKNMADTDFLTGLCNHRNFILRGNTELKRSVRSGNPLSLSVFDIDYFKKINDTYGHLAGDNVLSSVAEIVGSCLRQYDIFARIGGDEFAIMMPETDAENAKKISERVIEKVKDTVINAQGSKIRVTISMGLNTVTGEALDQKVTLEKVFTGADNALYDAKRAGRNCLSLFQQDP